MNRTSPPSSTVVETRRANDNYGCVLVAQPDQSQGRPITTAGSRPIVSPRPARPGSPEAPRPGARTLREGPSLVQAASSAFSCSYNSRLHHVVLDVATSGLRVLALVADLDVRVLTEDGELLRALRLDPSRDYQPQG